MQLAIARYRKYAVVSTVFASSLALIGASGGFRALVRFGDITRESSSRVISDRARNVLDHLDPTSPRCF
jgi:chromosome condensin MukBEF MukE localization factor